MTNTKLMTLEALRHLPLEPKDVLPVLEEDEREAEEARQEEREKDSRALASGVA